MDLCDLIPASTRKIGDLESYSLEGLAVGLLGEKPWKDNKIVRSDWEQNILTAEQIRYASYDAIVGVKLFLKLLNNSVWHNKPDRETVAKFCSLSVPNNAKHLKKVSKYRRTIVQSKDKSSNGHILSDDAIKR
eukprot:UN34596